jgi:uncharacterized protein (DUF1501 family)
MRRVSRRDFLKTTCTVSVISALPGTLQAMAERENKTERSGIVAFNVPRLQTFAMHSLESA